MNPSPAGKGESTVGEGSALSLRERLEERGFKYRVRLISYGPHPQPFSRWEKGE